MTNVVLMNLILTLCFNLIQGYTDFECFQLNLSYCLTDLGKCTYYPQDCSPQCSTASDCQNYSCCKNGYCSQASLCAVEQPTVPITDPSTMSPSSSGSSSHGMDKTTIIIVVCVTVFGGLFLFSCIGIYCIKKYKLDQQGCQNNAAPCQQVQCKQEPIRIEQQLQNLDNQPPVEITIVNPNNLPQMPNPYHEPYQPQHNPNTGCQQQRALNQVVPMNYGDQQKYQYNQEQPHQYYPQQYQPQLQNDDSVQMPNNNYRNDEEEQMYQQQQHQQQQNHNYQYPSQSIVEKEKVKESKFETLTPSYY